VRPIIIKAGSLALDLEGQAATVRELITQLEFLANEYGDGVQVFIQEPTNMLAPALHAATPEGLSTMTKLTITYEIEAEDLEEVFKGSSDASLRNAIKIGEAVEVKSPGERIRLARAIGQIRGELDRRAEAGKIPAEGIPAGTYVVSPTAVYRWVGWLISESSEGMAVVTEMNGGLWKVVGSRLRIAKVQAWTQPEEEA
jgi:hypothetical protein